MIHISFNNSKKKKKKKKIKTQSILDGPNAT